MIISTSNIAKKIRNVVNTNRAGPNRRDGKNKYSSSQKLLVRARKRRRNKKRPIYNRCEQREKLL